MPVARIKVRLKKKNKPPLELTDKDREVLWDVLNFLRTLHEVYGLGIMHILEKMDDPYEEYMKTETEGEW